MTLVDITVLHELLCKVWLKLNVAWRQALFYIRRFLIYLIYL